MLTNQPNEADFVWEFNLALCESVDIKLKDWIARWPEANTRESVACSLLRCACEHRNYDLEWLAEQLSDPQLPLAVETQQQLLRDVFQDQTPSVSKPIWGNYQHLGFSASELDLRCPEDRCYLGQTVGDSYILQSRIASGGLGTVYQGIDKHSQAEVAIKIPLRMPPDAEDLLAHRIRDEATILAAISLLGIPHFVELLETVDGPALITQLISGVTLHTLVAPNKLLEDQALLLASKVARIADSLHREGFVHGDIKATNVMVDDEGNVTLIDFNVSRQDNPALMQEGFPGGTLPMMSPEAIVGVASDVDLRQDVYALGTLLHYCISGEELFSSKNREEAIVKSILMSGVHEPEFPEGISEHVRKICLAAISRHPTSRFETAGDLALTCEKVLAKTGSPIGIPPSRPWLSAWRLGCMFAMMLVRQRRVTTAFAEIESLNPEQGHRGHLAETLGYAMGVATALGEVMILAKQLDLAFEPWPGAEAYASAFYRHNKLDANDVQELSQVVAAGEQWCGETLGSLQTLLIEQQPVAAIFFMSAVQSQMVPYSKDAALRWLQCRKQLPVPEAVIGDFQNQCEVYSGHEGLLSAVQQLDYQMVKWLRWESPEGCEAKETGGV